MYLYDKNNLNSNRNKKFPIRFSLIVPVYNEEENIASLLNNLLRLDFHKQQYEIIIQDDYSQDKTYKIASEFSKCYPLVKVHQNYKNLGIALNRNAASNHSQGEIMIHMDADAFYPFNILQIIDNNFKTIPNLIALGGILLPREDQEIKVTMFDRMLFQYLRPFWSVIGATGNLFCIKSEIFWKMKGFQEPNGIKGREDLDLWNRLETAGCKDKMKIDILLPVFISLRRVRNSKSYRPIDMILDYLKIADGSWVNQGYTRVD